mmetsp:Transcript_6793/g.14151  ORF Transcript_6793/g.14151 Transcript_6793/m.14151 type:complete len:94 (-) Transcript_6793:216-497(-)
MHGFDRQGIAKALAAHPSYRSAAHGILDLLRKIPSATIVSMEINSDNKWRRRAISSSISSLTGTLATMNSSTCSVLMRKKIAMMCLCFLLKSQ